MPSFKIFFYGAVLDLPNNLFSFLIQVKDENDEAFMPPLYSSKNFADKETANSELLKSVEDLKILLGPVNPGAELIH